MLKKVPRTKQAINTSFRTTKIVRFRANAEEMQQRGKEIQQQKDMRNKKNLMSKKTK